MFNIIAVFLAFVLSLTIITLSVKMFSFLKILSRGIFTGMSCLAGR